MRLLHHEETNEESQNAVVASPPRTPLPLDTVAAHENAGETRLTPQEAAEAVAALEAQRLAQSSHAAGTISVDEIIAQLGIDATPEELLAARRRAHEANAAKASVPLTAAQPLTQRRRRNLVLIFTGMGGTAAVLLALMQHNLRQQSAMAAVAAAQPVSVTAPVAEATSTTTNAISLADVGKLTLIDKSSGHPVARLMSEIPDNRPVNVQANVLANTLNIPRTKDYEYGAMKGWWTAKKEHGRVFLKAFLPLQESPGLMVQGNVVVANRSTRPNGVAIGPDPTPVWIPLDRVRSLDCFYSTDSGSKEGDNNGGTFAPDSEGATNAYSNKPLSSDWARATLDGLKPGDLQSAR